MCFSLPGRLKTKVHLKSKSLNDLYSVEMRGENCNSYKRLTDRRTDRCWMFILKSELCGQKEFASHPAWCVVLMLGEDYEAIKAFGGPMISRLVAKISSFGIRSTSYHLCIVHSHHIHPLKYYSVHLHRMSTW